MTPRISLALPALVLLTACMSVPSTAIFNDRSVPVYNALSITCSEPYAFVNDCSMVGGPRKKLKIGERELWVAGTRDGKTVFSRNVVRAPSPAGDEAVANDIIAVARQAGIRLVNVELVMTGSISSGHLLSFDGDVYGLLARFVVPG